MNIDANGDMKKEKQIENRILLLHNIRSVYNVGAIFRTADAIGISKIILSGYTPRPIDRFGRKRSDFHKCALGSEESVKWEEAETPFDLIGDLKKEGFKVVGLEQGERAVDYKKLEDFEKIVVVVGTEAGGMDQELQDKCDIISDIPMNGEKDSLNVSVAVGIFLYGIFDK